MKDAGFVKILDELAKGGDALMKYMRDHRVMTALAVLLDVDIQVPGGKDNHLWHGVVKHRCAV